MSSGAISADQPPFGLSPINGAQAMRVIRMFIIFTLFFRKISPGKAGGFKDVSRSKRLGGDADAAPKLEPPEGGFFDRGRRRTN